MAGARQVNEKHVLSMLVSIGEKFPSLKLPPNRIKSNSSTLNSVVLLLPKSVLAVRNQATPG